MHFPFAENTVIVQQSGTDWITPIATLIAVMAGALLAGWIQHLATKRAESGDAKAAARIIQSEISAAASRVREAATDDHRWFEFNTVALAAWPEFQGVLARHLTDDEWDDVAQAAASMRALDDGMTKAFAPGGPLAGKGFRILSSQQVARMGELWSQLTEVHNALARLAERDRIQGKLHAGEPTSNALMAQNPSTSGTRW